MPNYSRFPADRLGMNSKLSLTSLKRLSGGGRVEVPLRYSFYQKIAETFQHSADNDIMPWDFRSNRGPRIRTYELVAIAPDLFDITYYSIEPNFNSNYLLRLRANRGPLGIPTDIVIRGDLGTRGMDDQNLVSVSVQTQMSNATSQGDDIRRNEAFYFVRDKAHLLTAWLPNKEDFSFDALQR